MDAKLRKYPARNEGPRYSHDEIADEAQARTLDNLAGQPAGRDADSQYDEKAFTRDVHCRVLTLRPPGGGATTLFQNRPERGWILCKIAQASVVRAALRRRVHSRGSKESLRAGWHEFRVEFVQGGIEICLTGRG